MTLGTVEGDLSRLRTAVAADRLVNVVGPLGSGKSALLAALAPDALVDLTAPGAPQRLRSALAQGRRLIAVDGIDSTAALLQAQRILAARHTSRVVLAGRTPVTARREWDGAPPTLIRTTPWQDREIDAFAVAHGLTGADERRFVVRLAGGNPLVARCLIAAVHRGAPVTQPSVVADHPADVITTRLRAERPVANWRGLLRVLAALGAADQELLGAGDDDFAAVARLSIVSRTRLGLAVDEPYRTILDLSQRWRRPVEHRTTLTTAGVHRVRMLSETSDHELRKDLTLHGLFLTDEPHVRAMLFPPRPARPPVTVAGEQDVDDISRLIRTWALDGELDTRATDRLADRWLREPPRHFHVSRDADGRPAALAQLVPFADAATGGVEPVAQQFTERFADEPDGMFVITGHWPDEAAGAVMLRRILEEGIDHGRIVVCTPKPEYQRLARGMGLPHYGTTRHDTFGAGHATHVFSQRMAPGDLPTWLARLTGRHRQADYLTEEVVHALESLRAPVRLTRSPLLAAPHTDTPDALRAWLAQEIEALAHSDDPREAESGALLRRRYLDHATEHASVATRLGLTRATYSHRLSCGLTALTDRFRTEGRALLADPAVPATPGPQNAETLDDYALRLRALREWAGSPSYAEIARRIERLRAARRHPAGQRRPSRVTVYDCFRLGRRRLDVELVADIVRALGGTDADVLGWRLRYRSIT